MIIWAIKWFYIFPLDIKIFAVFKKSLKTVLVSKALSTSEHLSDKVMEFVYCKLVVKWN